MEIIPYKNHSICIYEDDLSEDNPREWEPLGTILSFMRDSNISDDDAPNIYIEDFNSLEEVKGHLIKKYGAVVILSVYAYIHSGMTISTKPFSCPWDSGQAGFIYTTRERILRANPGAKIVTKKLRDEAAATLEGEIEYLDIYLNGEGYGYVIDPEGEEDVDERLGGYFEKDAAITDAKLEVDRLVIKEE